MELDKLGLCQNNLESAFYDYIVSLGIWPHQRHINKLRVLMSDIINEASQSRSLGDGAVAEAIQSNVAESR